MNEIMNSSARPYLKIVSASAFLYAPDTPSSSERVTTGSCLQATGHLNGQTA